MYLTDAGFEIVRAYSGKEALQCVLDPDQQIDLIIMDVMMPEVNGIEATKKIRELYNIPIIMLSAKSEDEDKITGLKIGADDYMTKPFNPEELVARVESQLRRIEMIREGKNKRSDIYEGWMKNKNSAMISCNDGFRPVSFYIEVLDEKIY